MKMDTSKQFKNKKLNFNKNILNFKKTWLETLYFLLIKKRIMRWREGGNSMIRPSNIIKVSTQYSHIYKKSRNHLINHIQCNLRLLYTIIKIFHQINNLQKV
jgi:hypothetical protein